MVRFRGGGKYVLRGISLSYEDTDLQWAVYTAWRPCAQAPRVASTFRSCQKRLEERMAYGPGCWVKVTIGANPSSVIGGTASVWLVGCARAIYVPPRVLQIIVEAHTDPRQDRRTQWRRLGYLRYLNRLPERVGLVLHPEMISRGPTDHHKTLERFFQHGPKGADHLHELIVEPFDQGAKQVAACDTRAESYESTRLRGSTIGQAAEDMCGRNITPRAPGGDA